MNIILLGPPGIGKGTQAEFISSEFKIPHISMGEIIRKEINSSSVIGLELKTYIDQGQLVPDNYTSIVIESRLIEKDCFNGFILDGFPRSVVQEQNLNHVLSNLKRKIDFVLYFNALDSILLKRIIGRRHDPKTGKPYHLEFNKPPVEIIERLVQRNDDTEEILIKRLKEYREKTSPLIQHYKKTDVFYEINGVETIEHIKNQIVGILRE